MSRDEDEKQDGGDGGDVDGDGDDGDDVDGSDADGDDDNTDYGDCNDSYNNEKINFLKNYIFRPSQFPPRRRVARWRLCGCHVLWPPRG